MRGKVLIVEDEPIVALDLKQELEMLGCEVLGVAESADEALVAAGVHRPDLSRERGERRAWDVHGIVETAEAVGHPYAREPVCRRAIRARRGRTGRGHRDAGSVRLPGVLDPGP